MVGLRIGGEVHQGQTLPAAPLDLARAGDPLPVGVEQGHRHHPGIVGRLPAILRVGVQDRAQVQLLEQVPQEHGQMSVPQVVALRGRQQPRLIRVPRAKQPGRTPAPSRCRRRACRPHLYADHGTLLRHWVLSVRWCFHASITSGLSDLREEKFSDRLLDAAGPCPEPATPLAERTARRTPKSRGYVPQGRLRVAGCADDSWSSRRSPAGEQDRRGRPHSYLGHQRKPHVPGTAYLWSGTPR